MSLSLPTIALIHGATRLAAETVRVAHQAIGFDKILGQQVGAGSEQPVEGGRQPVSLDPDSADRRGMLDEATRQLEALIGRRLRQYGFQPETNQPLRFRVHRSGQLELDGHHPQAQSLMTLLNADPGVREQLNQVLRVWQDGAGPSGMGTSGMGTARNGQFLGLDMDAESLTLQVNGDFS